jgi:arylsulfatase A-like enzyme
MECYISHSVKTQVPSQPQRQLIASSIVTLLLRLITIASIGLVIAFLPKVLELSDGWYFFERPLEVWYEIVFHLLLAAICGVGLAAITVALILPSMIRSKSRDRIVEAATRCAVAVIAFVDLRILIGTLLVRFGIRAGWLIEAVFAAYYLAFAIALLIPHGRRRVVHSMDYLLEPKSTRRAVIGLGAATLTVAAAGRALATKSEPPPAPRPAKRPDRNILLITFDALCAEDMSLYGYSLPTTPCIADFAGRSSVFTDFYSIGTFTTPSVASILTGLYPSEHGVYHLAGQFRAEHRLRTLPRLMREAGFATGATVSNPHAFFLADGISGDFDVPPRMYFPESPSTTIWKGLELLHPPEMLSGRDHEFTDLEVLVDAAGRMPEARFPGHFARLRSKFPPQANFQRAQEVLDRLPEGFFMWVHVMAPHFPYLPDPAFANRFLAGDAMRRQSQQYRITPSPRLYSPAQQPLVDKARLRYDEFLASADRAFGDFISGVESSGRMRNTSVIVSADHGESFADRLFGHQSRYLTRPQIHIPLIIHSPGQETGKVVRLAADQTSIAPTILELAGVPKPGWMRSESLLSSIRKNGDSSGQGVGFAQYLETNSEFNPIKHGNVGIISQGQQYTFDLDARAGKLCRIEDAHLRDSNSLASNPGLGRELHTKLRERFSFVPESGS